MRNDLSTEVKQTFQVVALLATILVVGIHFQSDVPDRPEASAATWNELAQEFLFGGVGRVAVPLFAFAAGFFYFRSDDGTLACYFKKLRQRARTVALPYFVIASVATTCWLLARRIESDPPELTVVEFLSVWLLRPPAEQLWFLRDLIVLVALAPLIGLACQSRIARIVSLSVLAVAWGCDWQCFPIVAGWHLLHLETLFFFALGAAAVPMQDWIERVARATGATVIAATALWIGLVAIRIWLRADFDIWYRNDFGAIDLMFHQASILVGCVALFMIAFRIRSAGLVYLSGGSFFVFLVHEFPLRAVIERCSDRYLDHSTSCWIVTPLVVAACFGAAVALSRWAPQLFAFLTGGRSPRSASQRTTSSTTLRTQSHAS